jgi:predicted outer membrane repeat protein
MMHSKATLGGWLAAMLVSALMVLALPVLVTAQELLNKAGQPEILRPGALNTPSPLKADFEYNTGGVIDFVPTLGGSATGWAEWMIATVRNDTGHRLRLTEFGFPCCGPPTGPYGWMVWRSVGGLYPPAGDPTTADRHGAFTPADPNPSTNPPTVYTYVDVVAQNIVIPIGSYFCFGYDVTGYGGLTSFNGVQTWGWYGGAWDPDQTYGRTAVLQVKANYLSRTWHVPGDLPTIANALEVSAAGDTIQVADGTYSEHNLTMTAGVVLRGNLEDPSMVVISGSNEGMILYGNNLDDSTIIEGITFTQGFAGQGGAMYLHASFPTVQHCFFTQNNAISDGGAIACEDASPTLIECTFAHNDAGQFGGAVYVVTPAKGTDGKNSYPNLFNCTFYANGAPAGGAAVFAYYAAYPELNNCILAFGSAGGAAACSSGAYISLSCCDVYGNSGGDYVGCLAGQLGVNGNISADPLFANVEMLDFTLLSDSPCAPANNPGCGLIGAWPAAPSYLVVDDGSGDFPTVQQAVDSAPEYSTIELADGTFTGAQNVDIDFGGKNLIVRSLNGNPYTCVIDCGGTPNNPHRAFWFHSGEGTESRVQGIAIVGGYAIGTRAAGGGGIRVGGGSSPVFENLILAGNAASSGGGGLHVGIYSSAFVTGCTFVANSSSSGGGGLHCEPASNVELSRCTFAYNSSPDACIYIDDSASFVAGNTIVSFTTGGGAGVECVGAAVAILSCCDVYGNDGGDWVGCIAAQYGVDGNIAGDPLFCDPLDYNYLLNSDSPCSPYVSSCGRIGAWDIGCAGSDDVIGFYTASDVSGATSLQVDPLVPFTVYLCVRNPSAPAGIRGWEAGIYNSANLTITDWSVRGSGVWFGEPPGDVSVGLSVPLPWGDSVWLATMQCVKIDADPAYLYIYPHTNSSCSPPAPCYVAGDVFGEIIPLVVSSGSYELPVFAAVPDLSGAPGPELPRQFALQPCYPNPFNPTTTIAYDLPRPADVSLKIFDLAGRLVRVLVDEPAVAAGRHTVEWNGRDDRGRSVAAGVYLARLKAGDFSQVRRMALVK